MNPERHPEPGFTLPLAPLSVVDRLQRWRYYLRLVPWFLGFWTTPMRGHVKIPGRLDEDYGRNTWRGRQTAVFARSVADIEGTMSACHQAGIPVTVGGAMHSARGQTLSWSDPGVMPDRIAALLAQCERQGMRVVAGDAVQQGVAPAGGRAGIRLILTPDPSDRPTLDRDEVEVSAAWHWRQLAEFLAARDRQVGVLTDNHDTSIGGTLSVGGGFGARSLSAGRQIDHVTALYLVCPDGAGRWYGPGDDLFDLALGGLGQLGVIARVRMRVYRRRPFVATFTFGARNLSEAFAAIVAPLLPRIEGGLAEASLMGHGLGVPWTEVHLGYPFAEEAEARRFLAELPPELAPLGSRLLYTAVMRGGQDQYRTGRSGQVSHFVQDHVKFVQDWFFASEAELLGFSRALESEVLPRCKPIAALILVAKREPLNAPLSYRPADRRTHPFAFGLGAYWVAPPGDRERIDACAAAIDEAHRLALRFGGQPYTYGWVKMPRDQLTQVFPGFGALMAKRATLPGSERFNPWTFEDPGPATVPTPR